ncbi:alpha-(1,3)-fucosyltransferase C-like [Aplysia californica]|uniref:Fucosyltransferase n=1 Tax=Aplysia californica TaxID=6500 RepID=A0ABM0JS15_APLCA|nr:alpha-(1,3)-fucosyltransferase C-like [Aplysia californica]
MKFRRFKRIFIKNTQPKALLALCCLTCMAMVLLSRFFGVPRNPDHPHNYIQYFPHREWRSSGAKTILLWTPRFGYDYWAMDPDYDFGECPVKTCRLTNDRTLLDTSDAVLFHSRALWNNFLGTSLPTHHQPHQVWVYQEMEPLPHVFLDLGHYKGVFNWTSTYRLDSDVPAVYSKLIRHGEPWLGWMEETDPAILWLTGALDERRRERIVNALSEFLPIDRYGRCGNLTLDCPQDFLCEKSLSQYRFYLSLENAVCTDYVTEKFFLPLQRRQIPGEVCEPLEDVKGDRYQVRFVNL